jgi:hypothetical protein
VSKLGDETKGDHVTHVWGWIERSITQSSLKELKCKGYNGGGSMMWMSFVMDRNKQEGKWLTIQRNALKWAKANNAPPKGSPW